MHRLPVVVGQVLIQDNYKENIMARKNSRWGVKSSAARARKKK